MRHKKYLLCVLFLTLTVICLVFSTNIMFLLNSGELNEIDKVCKKQIANEMYLYGTALHSDVFPYKMTLYELVKPEIVSIGSSRVMQFREKFFSKSFVNMGGAMNSINQGKILVDKMFNIYKPKIVILGVDYWWFNRAYLNPDTPVEQEFLYGSDRISIDNFKKPIEWLLNSKISFRQYFFGAWSNYLSQLPGIGLLAKIRNSGFGPDGSRYYTDIMTGQYPSDDIKFNNTYQRMKFGKNRFKHAARADKKHLNAFIDLVRTIKNNDVQLVVFFPPQSPYIANKVAGEFQKDYLYISDIKDNLLRLGVVFYDYSDPSILNSGNCEFIDGFHGGELTYARILKDFSIRFGATINPYIRMNFLDSTIFNVSGVAMLPDTEISKEIEVDFLELGCLKKH